MLFEEAWSELKSSVPHVDVLLGQKLVNRGWEDIRDSRQWSFLTAETTLTAPTQITDGTVTVVQGSPTVVLDGGAQAALVGLTTNQIVERTFRAGTSGHIYNIVGYAAPNLTLEYGFNDPSAAGITYRIYQPYYIAPLDFLSWKSVIDPYAPMPYMRITTTKEMLDARDPARGALGQPYHVSTYRYEELLAGSNPPITKRWRYELWPHPIIFRQYRALYQRRGTDLAAGQSQPTNIPDALLMCAAKIRAYEWAESNKGKHSALKGTDWIRLKTEAFKEYLILLQRTQRNDEETFMQNFPLPYMQTTHMELGSTYWQSHAPHWGGGEF